jgi:hypothetical protein
MFPIHGVKLPVLDVTAVKAGGDSNALMITVLAKLTPHPFTLLTSSVSLVKPAEKVIRYEVSFKPSVDSLVSVAFVPLLNDQMYD